MKALVTLLALAVTSVANAHVADHPHEHLSVALFIGVVALCGGVAYYLKHKK